MSEVTNAVIVERIEHLCDSMKDGFKGVHDRQDKTNGKVQANTEWRLKNLKSVGLVNKLTTIIITAVVVAGLALIINQ